MKSLIIKDVLKKLDGFLLCGDENESLDSFSINSKNIKSNDIFIGLKGKNIDGSVYYLEALENGAKGCILNKSNKINKVDNKFIIIVNDTIKALETLAAIKRELYDIPVIAITGSFGKTSTKDMIYEVLNKKYNVLKTEGNYNNNIGLSLTILKLNNNDILLLEMGMNNFNEIRLLSNISRPTIGIITNIGTSHIGNLGSRDNILKAKLEILDYLNGILIINNDNDLLHNLNGYVTVGINNKSDIMAKNIIIKDNTIIFDYNDEKYILYNVPYGYIYNALFSIYIAKLFKVPYQDIYNSLINYKNSSGRNEIIYLKKITIINDCYNSSIESLEESIKNLQKYNKRKIVVIGDILELGSYSNSIHKKINDIISSNKVDIVITIGEETKVIKSNHFSNNIDAYNYLISIIKEGDILLLKASHKMNFELIVDKLKKYYK